MQFLGTAHFDELQYLFSMRIYDLLNIKYAERGTTAYRIIERMTEMWVNFAKYG
jgi:carboxylesterase type B